MGGRGTAGRGRQPVAVLDARPRLIVPEEDPVDAYRLGGLTAQTELVTYPDGQRLVRKHHGERTEVQGFDTVALTDAEELAPLVMNAVGLRTAAVHRSDPTTIYMEYISGEGLDVFSAVPDELRDSRDGRLLGLADAVMHNIDRSNEQWTITPEGRIVGWDHGSTLDPVFEHVRPDADSPFAQPLYDTSGPEPTLGAPNDFTTADMAVVGKRLRALRPDFARLGRTEWHNALMRRYRLIAAAARGTTNVIT